MTNEAEPAGPMVPALSSGPAASRDAASDWRHSARCRDEDPETLFVQGAQQRDAREVCRSCPVRTECLAHALDNRVRFGVWGGMTERERRALLRRRPDVISWAALLESARRAATGAGGGPATPTSTPPGAGGRRSRRAAASSVDEAAQSSGSTADPARPRRSGSGRREAG